MWKAPEARHSTANRLRAFRDDGKGVRIAPMTKDALNWLCTCGKVEISLSPVKGSRCVCYCADCQAFLRYLGREDLFEPASGTDLLQAMSDQVQVTKGAENLACLKLSEKGPLRWYTLCCNTPICNGGSTRKVPLASMFVRHFSDPAQLPAVMARVNRKTATAQITGDPGSAGRLIRSFLGRAFLTLITDRFRKTPFFDASGAPVAKPLRLSKEQHAKAYGG